MDSIYTLSDLALMSGLTTRTIRSYLKSGQLCGEMKNGKWLFDEKQVSAFFNDPNVLPSIEAKNKAVLFDFLVNTHKKQNELCLVLDLAEQNPGAVSDFFCKTISQSKEGGIRYAYLNSKHNARIFLSGPQNVIAPILTAYFAR